MPTELTDKDRFELAMKFVREAEGGYYNHPNDPGGETMYGITKRDYPKLDIKNLSREHADEIFYNDYWVPSSAKHLHLKTAVAYFDCCVNTGRRQANKFLQRALKVKDDGEVGPITLKAATESDDHDTALRIVENRQKFYQGLADTRPKLSVFLKGWTNRNSNLRNYLEKKLA